MDNSDKIVKFTGKMTGQSSEMLSNIFELNPDAISLTRVSDGKIMDCNQSYLDQIGYLQDEVIGHTSLELNLFNLKERQAYVQAIQRNKTIKDYEIKVKQKDGTFIDVLYSARIIIIDGEELILSIGHDITERKLRENKFETLFKTMNLGVIYHNPEGKVISMNPSAERIMGYKLDELTNKTFDHVGQAIHEDGTPFIENTHPSIIALKTGKQVKNVIMGVNYPTKKETTWLEISAIPEFKHDDKKPYRVYTIFEDITERKNTEEYKQELLENEQQLTEELQSSNDELQSTSLKLQTSNEELHENEYKLIQINKQLEESHEKLNNSLDELTNTETILSAITNLSSDVIYVKDNQSRWIFANPALERIAGKPSSELMGKTDAEIYPNPLISDKILENDRRILTSGKEEILEETVETPDGMRSFISVKTPRFNENGQIIGIVGISHDITQRKKIENDLKRQASLLDVSYEAIFSWDFDQGILSWNKGAEILYGYGYKEAIGQISHDLLKTQFPIEFNEFKRCLNEKGVWTGEIVHTTKYGKKIIVESRQQLIHDTSGKKVIIETNRDITKRKEEQMLSNSLNNVNTNINSLQDYNEIMQFIVDKGSEALDIDSGIINIIEDDKWVSKFVYNFPDSVIGQIKTDQESSISRYVRDKKRVTAFNDAQDDPRINKGQMERYGIESVLAAPIILKDEVKGIIAFYNRYKSIEFSDAQIDFVSKLAASLSQTLENSQLLEEIMRSEEKYHSLYSSMNEGVAIHEIVYNPQKVAIDYVVTDVNHAYENILGLKRSDVIGRKASDIYGTVNPPYMELYVDVAQNGVSKTFDTYFEPMDKYFKISVISPEKGKFATVFEDISERKKSEKYRQLLLESEQQLTEELQTSNEELQSATEELQVSNEELREQEDKLIRINNALHESEAKYKSIIDNIQDAYIRADKYGNVIMVSESAARMYRFDSRAQMIGLQAISLYKYEDDRISLIEKLQKDGRVADFESEALRKDGTSFLVSLNSQFYYDDNGQIQGTEAFVRDIAERKKVEDKLMFQSNILSRVQDAIIATDKNFNIIYWNKIAEKMLGWTEEEALGRNSGELLQTKVDKSSREDVIEKVLKNGQFEGELYYLRKDGTYLPVELKIKISYDEKGEIIGLLTSVRDISER